MEKVLTIKHIVDKLNEEESKSMSTEKINAYFMKNGYTKGQISGVLYRAICNKVLEKPCRAMYKIADLSVLDILKSKVRDMQAYINQIPYIDYGKLDGVEKEEFDKLVRDINQLVRD